MTVSPVYANRKYCSVACKNSCEDFKRDCLIKNNLDLQKRRPTRLEIAGRALLEAAGVQFSEQVLIDGKFVVDVMISGRKIVIQWDGDYWHGFKATNDNVIPDPRVARRMALDRSQDAYMASKGLKVLRFWEHEVLGAPEAVRDRILLAATEERQAPPELPDLGDDPDPF